MVVRIDASEPGPVFWFSYGLINRSIDKWFSQPVEEVRADTAALSAQLLRLRRLERNLGGGIHRAVGGISKAAGLGESQSGQ